MNVMSLTSTAAPRNARQRNTPGVSVGVSVDTGAVEKVMTLIRG